MKILRVYPEHADAMRSEDASHTDFIASGDSPDMLLMKIFVGKPEVKYMFRKQAFVFLLQVTLVCWVSVFATFSVKAASVDTALTHSASMHKDIKAVVVTPANYSKKFTYPVLYLLHGYSGNYADWISKVPAIKKLSDEYNVIIVCPDGNFGSWYFDSPVDSAWKYETYVSKELVSYVDDHYATLKDRKGRAITGLSMGGHGALYLAFKHQDVYGATGSMSGGVDIRPFPLNWNLSDRLGSFKDHPDNWEQNTVINLLYLLTPGSLSITFDCGKDDFFYGVNKTLDEKLWERNIPHDFTVRPGGHTWEYWANSIQYQMVFFSNYFASGNKKQ